MAKLGCVPFPFCVIRVQCDCFVSAAQALENDVCSIFVSSCEKASSASEACGALPQGCEPPEDASTRRTEVHLEPYEVFRVSTETVNKSSG